MMNTPTVQTSALRLLVVDDHPVVRHGIRGILAEQAGIFAVTEADRGQTALECIQQQPIDLVLLDIGLPDMSGIELLRAIRRVRPHLPVLILSIYDERLYAVRAIRAGAQGYLTKDTVARSLVSAIQCCCAGKRYISPRLAETLAGMLASGFDESPHIKLSDREFEVMRMIAQGVRLREIADTLNLSPKTISTYRARLLEKMDLKSNADIARYTLLKGLLEAEP